MSVALCACHGRPHPCLHRSVDPVYDRDIPEFLIISAALVIGEGIAMKSGGNELIVVWVVKEISCKLLGGELIKGHVGINCSYDPVTVGPDCPWGIIGVAS